VQPRSLRLQPAHLLVSELKAPLRRTIRSARAALRLLRAHVARLPSPLKLNLCVTYRCQSRCQTCRIWQRRPDGELSTAELVRFVANNREAAWVDIMGGEIFLREDLPELLDAAAATWRRLALIHFATNGLLTDRIVPTTARLRAATAARVIVTVSVDGEEALNDRIRGVPGGFRRQLETFAALRRIRGVEVVLGMTLSRDNVGQVQQTFDACAGACPGLRPEQLHVNVAQRSAHFYGDVGDDVFATAEDLRRALDRYRRWRYRRPPLTPSAWVEASYLDGLDRFLTDGVTPLRCHALRSSCFVDPWGIVYPCVTDPRPIGNLRQTGMALEPIWRSTRAREVQRDVWRSRCPQCWTACEAYHTILGNLLRRRPGRAAKLDAGRASPCLERHAWPHR
jgi:radical SAM protein with 4Fe4S-binding SPASM domain